jgi:acyl-CoA synthetase (AMP-forming)/AMP-acid ligase II
MPRPAVKSVLVRMPAELKRRPSSVGIAIPGTEAYVVREDGTRAAPGETGELVIRGPHVMKGYWENPEATARALRDGPFPWEKVLYTGDLFRSDADGFLYFLGRKDDVIKSRGEKVSPDEVEAALRGHPQVADCAVLRADDPEGRLGQIVLAVVVPAPGARLAAEELTRFCASRLEPHKVPRAFRIVDSLPRTPLGKVDRGRLRAAQG